MQGEGLPPLEHLHLHFLGGRVRGGRMKEKSSADAAREVWISSLVLLTLLASLAFAHAFGQEYLLLINNSEMILNGKILNSKILKAYKYEENVMF